MDFVSETKKKKVAFPLLYAFHSKTFFSPTTHVVHKKKPYCGPLTNSQMQKNCKVSRNNKKIMLAEIYLEPSPKLLDIGSIFLSEPWVKN